MKRNYNFTLIKYILLLLLPMYSGSAFSWGQFGHVTICEIAYREITNTAREELNRLIEINPDYSTFNRACLRADRNPRTRVTAHFVNYSRTLESVENDNCPIGVECVISAIKSDFDILSDTTKSDMVRSNALIFLGHWVGDIHQPLHVSYADDRGGNRIKKKGRCSASNLHSVWDTCIVEWRVLQGNAVAVAMGWAKFTRAYRAADRLISNITDVHRDSWNEDEIYEWAQESYRIVRREDVGYCTKKAGSCWYDEDREFLPSGADDDELRVIQMNDEYLDRFTPIVETRMSQAGIRLAKLLNEALD